MLIQLPVFGSWVRPGDVIGVYVQGGVGGELPPRVVVRVADETIMNITMKCDSDDDARYTANAIAEAVNEALKGGP